MESESANPVRGRRHMGTETVRYYGVGGNGGVVVRGAVSGLAGGLAFTAWSMAMYRLRDESPWLPLNLVASSVWPGVSSDARFSPAGAAGGLAVILVLGSLLAAGYALLALNSGFRPVMVVVGAFTLANILWVFGHLLVWPVVDADAAVRFDTLTAWLGHGVYGLVTGLVLIVLERGTGLTDKPGGEPSDFVYGAVDKPMDLPHPFHRHPRQPPVRSVH